MFDAKFVLPGFDLGFALQNIVLPGNIQVGNHSPEKMFAKRLLIDYAHPGIFPVG